MKLDPKEFHRMRFEAALNLRDGDSVFSEMWADADAFLAAGGYECGEEAPEPSLMTEPSHSEWLKAWHSEPGNPDPAEFVANVSRRAHELARQRSQK